MRHVPQTLYSDRYRFLRSAKVIALIFALCASFLLFQFARMQIFCYEEYSGKVYDEITTTSPFRAKRGTIYDRNMKVMATEKTTYRVFVSTKEIKKYVKEHGDAVIDVMAQGLSDIFGLSKEKTADKLKNSAVLDVTIKNSVTEAQYDAVNEFILKNGLTGLIFTEAQSSREYPCGTLAAHVLGFTGSDGQGLYGLEYSYDSVLRGTDGYYLYAKDANGTALPGNVADFVRGKDGYSLVTTIDSTVQSSLESVLETIRVNHAVANRVTGIVMDTSTGAILGMATSSPFDPNDPFTLDAVSQQKLDAKGLSEGSEEYKAKKRELMEIMWSNKAVSELYEPGSTFKIVTVSAALDSGSSKVSDKFSCHGFLTVGGWRIKCHKVKGHGSGFDLSYGLQMSCNPTMMTIAERMGAETFYEYIEKFGYLQKTGIDLPSEASSIFHEKANIGPVELATISFGQRFKVSVISQLCAVAAVTNGGMAVTPYLVEKVIDADGTIIKQREQTDNKRVISEETAKTVAQILEEGVSGDGGAKNAAVTGYKVAAKTGTSQKFDHLDANGNSYLRIGSTVAFAPSDESGIAVILVVDEPTTSVKYGSTVAAPYVSVLLSDILPYLGYKKTEETGTKEVGNYIGMNVTDARKEILESGFGYQCRGTGTTVIGQIPEGSSRLNPEISKVILLTEGGQKSQVVMPNIEGKTVAEAVSVLLPLGLNLSFSCRDEKEADSVVATQSIPAGTPVDIGSVVSLFCYYTNFEE